MTRPVRIDLAGGWYHVTSRGNERKPIYRNDRDRIHWLELLEEMSESYGVRVHGYVLMNNHYHLLAETPPDSGWLGEAVREGLEETPWEQLQAGVVLGGEEFVDRIRSRLRGDPKEQPGLRQLKGAPGFDRVRSIVEELKGESWESFRDRRGDWGRDLALYVARKRCGMGLKELGAVGGGLGYTTVSMAVKRLEKQAAKSKKILSLIEQATRRLGL
jgi:hypothetical protein